jgi:hypothetical protein
MLPAVLSEPSSGHTMPAAAIYGFRERRYEVVWSLQYQLPYDYSRLRVKALSSTETCLSNCVV